MQEAGRFLLIAGVVLALVGACLLLLGSLGLGRLPGDIVIRRGHLTIYVPIVTSLLLSVLLTALLALLRR
jgi:Protein of unknown function (DUF2905)